MPDVHVHGYDNEVIFSPHDEESMNFKTITFTNYQTKLLFIIEFELLPQLKLDFFALMLRKQRKRQKWFLKLNINNNFHKLSNKTSAYNQIITTTTVET